MVLKFRGGLLGLKPTVSSVNTGTENPVLETPVLEKPNDAENQKDAAALASKETDAAGVARRDTSASDSSDNAPAKELQFGVQVAEATLQVWKKEHLIAAYVIMWFIMFLNAFVSGSTGTLTTYVTSDFSKHSLTATTNILTGVIPGLTKLAYAKFIDNFGRPAGLGAAITVMTLGLIMMAACSNVTTYCAAAVFYYTGYSWLDFTMTIFIADTSQLKNRAFLIGYAASPYLITVWVYGLACNAALADGGIGWRWMFGIFSIFVPVVTFPFWALLYVNQRKAVKAGLVQVTPHGRGVWANILFYASEFDIVGILLAAGGIGLFLLAISLYSYQTLLWRSALVICFLVFGAVLMVCFVLWEKFFAPSTLLPWHLIKNPTVFFTYTMAASIYTAWYVWDNYFYSFCIVVWDTGVTNATYIGNVYTIGSTVCSILFGIFIRRTGNLKWPAVFFGVPLTILGVGLMIHFRAPDVNIGYVVMCLIFIAFGGGTLVICEQMTVMAVSKHQDIPGVLAIESSVVSIAQSVGSTIAAAMWTSLFPKYLAKYLPADAQSSLTEIYNSIDTQSSYAMGSPTRDGISTAYVVTQRLMLIVATCLYSTAWISTMMWQNVNVKEIEQIKGPVMW